MKREYSLSMDTEDADMKPVICEGYDSTYGVPTLTLHQVEFFDISQSFDCGQCFRFERATCSSATHHTVYEGVAFGKFLRISQNEQNITLYGADMSDYLALWRGFFGLDEDYAAIRDEILDVFSDCGGIDYSNKISQAMADAVGIRILRQEPWEALCSFILSQNNNIPRIKKIIAALCEGLGKPFEAMGKVHYAFPKPEVICDAGLSGLAPFRMGFRARYVLDAAARICDGSLNLAAVQNQTTKEIEAALTAVCGVGKKVAACAMLYGLHKLDAFPVDVWMRRILDRDYPALVDPAALGRYAGIAQQYLFYHERENAQKGKRA